eukprot:scaffold150268_cov14-Prasinocladus_malaysianus.AAC.1
MPKSKVTVRRMHKVPTELKRPGQQRLPEFANHGGKLEERVRFLVLELVLTLHSYVAVHASRLLVLVFVLERLCDTRTRT